MPGQERERGDAQPVPRVHERAEQRRGDVRAEAPNVRRSFQLNSPPEVFGALRSRLQSITVQRSHAPGLRDGVEHVQRHVLALVRRTGVGGR